MKAGTANRRTVRTLGVVVLALALGLATGWRGFTEGDRTATEQLAALSALQQTRALQALRSGETERAIEILEEGLDVAVVQWVSSQPASMRLFTPPLSWGEELDVRPLVAAVARYRQDHPRHSDDSPVPYIDDELAAVLEQNTDS